MLDHIGKPGIRHGLVEPWKSQLRELASLPNVVCKLSGVVTEADHQHWRREQLRPYVEHVLDCFGFKRVMYGSDWTVSELTHAYPEWVAILDEITAGCSDDELRAFIATRRSGPIGWTSSANRPSARGRRRAAPSFGQFGQAAANSFLGGSARPARIESRRAAISPRRARGTTTTPSASPTTRSPVATGTPPTTTGRPTVPGPLRTQLLGVMPRQNTAGRPRRCRPGRAPCRRSRSRRHPCCGPCRGEVAAHARAGEALAGRRRSPRPASLRQGRRAGPDCRWGRTSR